MNGTNHDTPRRGDKPSLDALNRTIEGLEARIEGLIGNGGGKSEQRSKPAQGYSDQVSGILQRQRTLEGAAPASAGRSLADEVRARFHQPAPAKQPAPQPAYSSQPSPSAAMRQEAGDIAQALASLREELKRDINDGMSREMASLRAEIHDIRANSGNDDFASGLRSDMERLAASIEAASHQASPSEAATLQVEFDELRSMIDGLARQDSVRSVEAKLDRFNPEALESEILNLAGRIDDIKSQLGGMNAAPAIRQLEDKLFSIAEALESFGKYMPQDPSAFSDQFSDIDQRLGEISRAISHNAQNQAQQASSSHMKMLEERIGELGQQIEDWMSPRKEDGMVQRLEALSSKIEDMTNARTASRLEEQLNQLSVIVERAQSASVQPDLTPVLEDIARKIEALESGSVNSDLAERLDMLARRIEEIDIQPVQVSGEDAVFGRLESRLNDIAAHLNETVAQPAGDTVSLQNLEAQIANLSSLLSSPQAPQQPSGTNNSELESRMSSLEEYMAANDEYIVEAARQAAEAVAEAYSKKGMGASNPDAAGIAQISALAGDLRTLEELTRSSEERNQRTFEALHETLVQIAERIDQIGTAGAPYQGSPMPSEAAAAAAPAAYVASEPTHEVEQAPASAEPAMPRASQLHLEEEVEPEDDLLIDDIPDLSEDLHQDAPEEPEKKGLLAGLGRKIKGGRASASSNGERNLVEPSPPLDAGDSISPEIANQLLEPGSGAPDIRSILEKVRATQGMEETDEGDRTDYIAAARRAAKAAAEQVEIEQAESRKKPKKASKKQKKQSDSEPSKVRRPLMLAAGAALLAVMSYQLVTPLLGDSSAEAVTVEGEPAVADVAAQQPADAEADTSLPGPLEKEIPADAPTIDKNVSAGSIEPGGEDVAFEDEMPAETEAQQAVDAKPLVVASVASPIDISDEVGPKPLVDAANANDPLALYEVGARYSEGRGVDANMDKALALFGRSAELGFAPAEYRLGNMYEKGAGVAKDMEKAREYYQSAADQGNVSAMHNLAVVYAVGVNGQPDYEQSAKWFTEAANHGVKDSQFNLAILYAKGSGVPQDLGESYKWFDIAARAGDADAGQKRDEIAKALTPEQLKAAKTSSAEWKQMPANAEANEITLPDAWEGKGTKTSTVDMKRAVRNIQAILNNNGFDAGSPDGIMGGKTVAAIKAFQTSIGQEATGEINEALVRELLARNK